MQLYEKDLCDLDEDVSKYLGFELKNPNCPDINITLRMLLSHRSSLFDYCIFSLKGMFETLVITDIFNDLGLWLEKTLVEGEGWYNSNYWQKYEPGVKADYSNVGFFIIGYIVERLSGMSMEDYYQENIFKPLGMINISYHLHNLDEEKMATPYIKKAGFYIALPHYDAMVLAVMGRVRRNLEDLSHFLIDHMYGGAYKGIRILDESTIELMHNCIYDTEEGALIRKDYDLGWWAGKQSDKVAS